jgi:hypothetical protein
MSIGIKLLQSKRDAKMDINFFEQMLVYVK